MSVCQKCGVELPPKKSRAGSPRKWCSDRCRKSQYDKACMDCGTRIDGTTPGKSGGRCLTCANRQGRPRDRILRATIEALWADGYTTRQICAFLGKSYHPSYLSQWRNRSGYDLPYRRTREQVARISAGGAERFAHARAVVYAEQRRAA